MSGDTILFLTAYGQANQTKTYICLSILALNMLAGILGFGFHVLGNLAGMQTKKQINHLPKGKYILVGASRSTLKQMIQFGSTALKNLVLMAMLHSIATLSESK